jgi:hypothetical protein
VQNAREYENWVRNFLFKPYEKISLRRNRRNYEDNIKVDLTDRMARVCTLFDCFRIRSSCEPTEDGNEPAVHMNGREFSEYLKKHQFHMQNSFTELDRCYRRRGFKTFISL